jgi:HSP20 family protein
MAEKAVSKSAGVPATRGLDPLLRFRSEMDRLFDSFFNGGAPPRGLFDWRAASEDLPVVPQLELTENEKGFRITAELPGLDAKDVEVTLDDGLLTLKGEKKSETSSDKDNVHVTERRYGSFLRQVRLPDSIDADKVKASFDKGVLTVEVAKQPEAAKSAKKIEIGKVA